MKIKKVYSNEIVFKESDLEDVLFNCDKELERKERVFRV